MAKRRNDYRLTKRGFGIDTFKGSENIAFAFEAICPNCHEKCEQQKIERYAEKGKKAYQLHCSNCGFRRFDEYVDRSNYKRSDAKKGRLVQAFKEYLWDWLSEHIETILSFEIPNKINLFVGRMGTPRRHKGKPVFSSSELHPEFLRYLDTPEYIKQLSHAIHCLEGDDPESFDFIILRAMGYSLPLIDEGDFFPGKLTKPRKTSVRDKNGYTRTDYCLILERKATDFFIHSIPPDLLKTFGTKNEIDAIFTVTERSKRKYGDERVTCPKCDGKDSSCSLCRTRQRRWDGTVPSWLHNKYHERIASGGTWD